MTRESTDTPAMDVVSTTARVSAESIQYYWVTDTGRKTAPSKESWYMEFGSTSRICGDRREIVGYTGFTKRVKRDIRDYAGRVAGTAIRQGDVVWSFRLPGYRRVNEVGMRDDLHVDGAHNSLSQSRLMDRGQQIVPLNGIGIEIYDTVRAMGTASSGQGSLVAVAPQVGALFRFDVDAAGKGGQSSEVPRGRK